MRRPRRISTVPAVTSGRAATRGRRGGNAAGRSFAEMGPEAGASQPGRRPALVFVPGNPPDPPNLHQTGAEVKERL